MKVIGYIRVSTDDQDMSGLGLADQAEKVTGYCKLYDLELVAIKKDAASGKNMDRPEFQNALDMLKKGHADGLIVAKLDRLTRSVKDMGFLLEKYFQNQFSLFVVSEQIDTRTASGRLMLNVLTSIAQWERETIGERTTAALRQKRERGEKTGGHIPYGWKQVRGKLIEEPEEQKIIGKIRKWKSEGTTYQAIAERLNQSGIASKTGKIWNPGTVFRILKKAA